MTSAIDCSICSYVKYEWKILSHTWLYICVASTIDLNFYLLSISLRPDMQYLITLLLDKFIGLSCSNSVETFHTQTINTRYISSIDKYHWLKLFCKCHGHTFCFVCFYSAHYYHMLRDGTVFSYECLKVSVWLWNICNSKIWMEKGMIKWLIQGD